MIVLVCLSQAPASIPREGLSGSSANEKQVTRFEGQAEWQTRRNGYPRRNPETGGNGGGSDPDHVWLQPELPRDEDLPAVPPDHGIGESHQGLIRCAVYHHG